MLVSGPQRGHISHEIYIWFKGSIFQNTMKDACGIGSMSEGLVGPASKHFLLATDTLHNATWPDYQLDESEDVMVELINWM